MRSDKQRERQRKSRDKRNAKRKQRKTAQRAERAERKQSKAIKRTYRTDKRAPLGSKCEHQKCRTGTLRRTQSGRILSTTAGYVQGPVPVRASI